MKKITGLIISLLCALISFAQLPSFPNQNVNNSTAQTIFGYLGGLTSNGYKVKYFTDTTTANNQMYLKYTPHLMIKCGDDLYIRNTAISKWLLVGGASTSITTVFQGVDSVTTPSVGILCVWTGGLSNCFTVTTPVTPSGNVDSVTVINNQLCYYTSGVPTCYTVSNTIINNTQITQYIDSSIQVNNYYNNINCESRVISGSVIWVNGFNFSNTKLVYQIGCQIDSLDAGDFSITGSDTADRYTIVWADTLGNLGTTDGSVGVVASIPNVDPRSQILLATYFIPANSTEPQLLTNTVVYKENVEWTGTSNISGIDFEYTTNPYQGIYSTYAPSVAALSTISYSNGTDNLISGVSFVSFYVRISSVSTGFYVNLISGGFWARYVNITSGSYGFNGSLLNTWQLVVIPVYSFIVNTPSNIFTSLEFWFGASGGAVQFDNVILQGGGNNQSTIGVQSVNGATDNVYIRQKYNADSTYFILEINGVDQPDSIKTLKHTLLAGTNVTFAPSVTGDSTTVSSSGGGTILNQKTAYVDSANGNNSTALLGRPDLPFATIQRAVDSIPDGGTVIIGNGTFNQTATVVLKSNQAVYGSGNTVLKKTAAYSYVFANEAAYDLTHLTTDSNITIQNLIINCDDQTGALTIPTGDGEIQITNANKININTVQILHVVSSGYAIHWQEVINSQIKSVKIISEGDGIHLNNGCKNIVIDDAYIDAKDDNIAVLADDYPQTQYSSTDIDNIVIQNVIIDTLHNAPYVGYAVRYLTGSWLAWNNGNTYNIGNSAVNAGKVYKMQNAGPTVGTVAPTHSSGTVTGADGIVWRFMGTGTNLSANIYNVKMVNVQINGEKKISRQINMDAFDYGQYPTTDGGEVNGLYFKNLTSTSITPIFRNDLGITYNSDLKSTGTYYERGFTNLNHNINIPDSLFIGKSLQLGNGTDIPIPSAIASIISTTKGLLIPRLNTTEMNALSAPWPGLLITNTDSLNRIFIYTGAGWKGVRFTNETNSQWLNGSGFIYYDNGRVVVGSSADDTYSTFQVDGLTALRGKTTITGDIVSQTNSTAGGTKFGIALLNNGGIGLPTTTAAGVYGITGSPWYASTDLAFYANNSGDVSSNSATEFMRGFGDGLAIGATSKAASSILDITSTTKGLLIPRVNTTQMNAISSPASGLMVINTDSSNRIFTYTGSAWKGLAFTSETGGGASAKAYAPLVVRNDSVYQRYNVLTYGAIPDDAGDDRDAIQAAINAAYDAGGGTVFFPDGKYLIQGSLVTSGTNIGNPNSQLYIKKEPTPYSGIGSINIELIGESAPAQIASSLINYSINRGGVIIYSDLTGSGTYPAILGTDGTSWAYGYINPVSVYIKNINFRVKANIGASGPTMSAINLKYASYAEIENVLCDLDTSSNLSVYPVAETFGIYLPMHNNNVDIAVNKTLVTGYKYGYVISEHTNGTAINAMVCEHAFVFAGGGHSTSFGRLGSFWCKYSMTGPIGTIDQSSINFHYTKVNELDIEIPATGSEWYQPRYVIYDSLSHLYGSLNFHIVKSAAGIYNSNFNKLGGDSLFCRDLLNNGLMTANLQIKSNAGVGENILSVENTNSASASFLTIKNNGTGKVKLFSTGSAYVTPSLYNIGLITTEGNLSALSFMANSDVSSGGTATINFLVGGYSATPALTINANKTLTAGAYGAGTATFDASGNITSVSDERLKTDIQYYKSGLKELMKLKPIQYKWNKLSGNETKETYAGFSAQNVKENIKFGTGENKDGYLSLQDRAIMATLVNAVQEQQQQIEELKEEIKKLKK